MVGRAIVLGTLLAAAGCIEPELVACGDLSCPVGTTCLGARCVTPDQLSACDGVTEGGVCSIDNAIGKCTGGVCDPVGCGNGRVDDNEVCDDGNTGFGDGCSGDCRSVETCGNGIVDVAAGESCDCGDTAHKPDRCRSANSASIDAECSPSCELRYCGDGAIDTLEQCDGALLGGQSCTDFGYYHGALACSDLCRFDVSTCVGRCGDGSIEPAFGEYCDGAPPQGSCLTVGYDAGTLACSSACTPQVASCEAFGWRQLDTASVRSVWAGASDILVIGVDGSARMVITGIPEPAPAGVYRVAAGAGTTGYAIGVSSIAVWSGTAWSMLAPGWPTTATPTAAWASSSLGLYVVAGGGLWRYAGGTWTDQGATGVLGVTGDATRVFRWTANALHSSLGGAWTAESLPALGATSIAGFASSGAVWWLGTADAQIRRGAPGVAFSPPGPVEAFTSMVAAASGDLVIAPSMRRLFADGRADEMLAAPAGPVAIAVSLDGGIVIGATTGAFRIRTGAWGVATFISNTNFLSDALTYHVTTRGTRQIFSGFSWICSAGYCDYNYDAPNGLWDFVEAADQNLLYATDTFGELGLWAYDANVGDWSAAVVGDLRTLAIGRSGAIVAAGPELVARGGQTVWNQDWSTYAVTGYNVIAADEVGDNTSLFAIGQPIAGGGAVILEITQTGAITVLPNSATAPWQGLYVAPDGTVFAVGGDTVWSLKRGSTQPVIQHVLGADLRTISGTGVNDIFIGGRVLPFSTFTGVSHWNGVAWTSVRLPDAKTPLKMFVTSSLITYVFGRNFYDLPRVVLW